MRTMEVTHLIRYALKACSWNANNKHDLDEKQLTVSRGTNTACRSYHGSMVLRGDSILEEHTIHLLLIAVRKGDVPMTR